MDPENLARKIVQRIDLAILLLFPYLLYRFAVGVRAHQPAAGAFRRRAQPTLVTATLVLPCVPAEGERGRGGSSPTRSRFVVHWSVLLTIVAIRLWRAGRDEASVARKRMRMLAFASSALTAALVFSLAPGTRLCGGARWWRCSQR